MPSLTRSPSTVAFDAGTMRSRTTESRTLRLIQMTRCAHAAAIRSHAIWFAEHGGMLVGDAVKPGCVVVTATAGCPETGIW